jgi:exosortase E/protease (VPEID-CTERM system)
MTSPTLIADDRTTDPARPPLPLARWAVLAALFLGELAALSLVFQEGLRSAVRGNWYEGLRQLRHLPLLGIAAVAAVVLLAGAPAGRALVEAVRRQARPHPWPWLLAGHLAAFAGFTWLTARLVANDPWASAGGLGWALAWTGVGLLTLALWSAAVFPVRLWGLLARRDLVAVLLAGVVIGAAAWGTSRLTEGFWYPLSRSTLALVEGLLRLTPWDVVCQPDACIVGTPAFRIRVAASCSGYEGIGLIWVFLAAYLWVYRAEVRFPQALLLLPVGTVVVWLANGVRIAALIAVGTWGAPEVALGGFHTQVGWLFFSAIALGMVAVSRRVSALPTVPRLAEGASPTLIYLAPMLVVLAASMITGAFASGTDWLYSVRVLTAAVPLWLFRRAYAGLGWSWSWPAVAVGAGVFVLWLALEPAAAPGANGLGAALARMPAGWAAAWLAFRVVGAVAVVPLAEELAFRGYLTRRLMAASFQEVPPGQFSWLSFLGSSLLFGALHGRWLAGTLAGAAYALCLYRRGRLADAVLAHAFTNALLAGYVLATGTWSLWS